MPLLGVLLMQFFIWWYIFSNIQPSDEQIFLHYNIIFGIDLVGVWWKILYLPIIGGIMFLFNFLLSYFFYNFDRFLARLLAAWIFLIHIFLLVAVVLLVGLNI